MRTSKRISVNDKDRMQLERIIGNRNTAQKIVLRARIVLLSGDGMPTASVQTILSNVKRANEVLATLH